MLSECVIFFVLVPVRVSAFRSMDPLTCGLKLPSSNVASTFVVDIDLVVYIGLVVEASSY